MTLTVADLRGDLANDGEVGKSDRPRSDRPKRRSFTPEYKLAMVEAYDTATEPGAKGALLRREGLYHSHIIEWRKARDAGALNPLAAKPSGPKTRKSEAEKENERLRARAEKAERELAKTKAALEIMGKAHALLA
ncbi:transposase [Nonomuraea phyllanthi]|uniref:transposase n=1 Tax=Nonomuraea phyllanthi TaxID=2219224 RepID=UPI001884FB75|nr:transposase [Nonomuraea phyllanthi]